MNSGDTLSGKESAFTLISPISVCSETITTSCKKGNGLIKLLRLLDSFKCFLKNVEKKLCFL